MWILEIVYKDAFEYEFFKNDLSCEREQEYTIRYKSTILKHKFFANFVIMDQVILEIKAKSGIFDEDYAQIMNYLKCSGNQVGLILNFGTVKLGIKRFIF